MRKFLQTHTIKILKAYEEQMNKPIHSLPLDTFIKNYYRQNKSLGSTDRSVVSENVYAIIKQKIFLDMICPKPVTWEKRLEMYGSKKFYDQLKNPSLSLATRCSCPNELFDLVAKEYGEEKAFEYMNVMNEKAPLTIRINPLKTTRDHIFDEWRKIHKYKLKKCDYSPYGIQFLTKKNVGINQLDDFHQGKFEIQDEASQLVSLRVECEVINISSKSLSLQKKLNQPHQKVLDYCAGSGGKSLAFAPRLKGTGQVFLHDIREKIMIEAKKRFNRAGIQNVQFHSNNNTLKEYYHKMDWVVLDMPCTGTGTLRRNPSAKLKFSLEKLEYNVDLQQSIFDEAIKYICKNGKIVYITCSLLPQENIEQILKFCKKYNLEIENNEQFQSLPESNQMDAFYSVTLKFKQVDIIKLLSIQKKSFSQCE